MRTPSSIIILKRLFHQYPLLSNFLFNLIQYFLNNLRFFWRNLRAAHCRLQVFLSKLVILELFIDFTAKLCVTDLIRSTMISRNEFVDVFFGHVHFEHRQSGSELVFSYDASPKSIEISKEVFNTYLLSENFSFYQGLNVFVSQYICFSYIVSSLLRHFL